MMKAVNGKSLKIISTIVDACVEDDSSFELTTKRLQFRSLGKTHRIIA